MDFEGFANIDEYFLNLEKQEPIDTSQILHFEEAIKAHTNLTSSQAHDIVTYFFKEVRLAMLRGEIVTLSKLGKFYLSSPKTVDNSFKNFLKFIPMKKIRDYINEQ